MRQLGKFQYTMTWVSSDYWLNGKHLILNNNSSEFFRGEKVRRLFSTRQKLIFQAIGFSCRGINAFSIRSFSLIEIIAIAEQANNNNNDKNNAERRVGVVLLAFPYLWKQSNDS